MGFPVYRVCESRPCCLSTTVVTAASAAGFAVTLFLLIYFNKESTDCACSVLRNETLSIGPCVKMQFAARKIKCDELDTSAHTAFALMIVALLTAITSAVLLRFSCQHLSANIRSGERQKLLL